MSSTFEPLRSPPIDANPHKKRARSPNHPPIPFIPPPERRAPSMNQQKPIENVLIENTKTSPIAGLWIQYYIRPLQLQ